MFDKVISFIEKIRKRRTKGADGSDNDIDAFIENELANMSMGDEEYHEAENLSSDDFNLDDLNYDDFGTGDVKTYTSQILRSEIKRRYVNSYEEFETQKLEIGTDGHDEDEWDDVRIWHHDRKE